MKYNIDYINQKNSSRLEKLVNQSWLLDKPLGYSIYDHAYIVPADMSDPHFHRGVLTSQGEIVDSSLLFEGFEPDWANSVELYKAQKRTETVIFLGWLEPVWGHILTDCLKKLWFIRTDLCKQYISEGAKFVAIIPWHSKALDTIFDLLGFKIENIENIKVLTQFEKVIIPDNSIIRNSDDTRYYTKEYSDTVKLITDKIPETKPYGKYYFTRTSFAKNKIWQRREYGESEIESVFRKMGYTVISPEKLNPIETMTLIKNCESFASTEGSISHNVLFCKPGTDVIIVRKVDFVNTWQLIVNQVANVNVTYIDAHKSIISSGCSGPFYMSITKEMEKFVGHSIFHIPYFLKPSFWWYLIQNRKITKRILISLNIIQ